MKPVPDWFDTFHGAYARNLNRILEGRVFVQEADEELPGYLFTVERVTSVTVGLDSAGIFAGVTVCDYVGRAWTFYNDGTVADADDVTAGRHTLALGPDPEPIQKRQPAGPLFALAAGLARAEAARP